MRHTLGESFAAMRLGAMIAGELLDRDRAVCVCKHFYVAIDDGKYLEKCVLCDEPKSLTPAA